MLAWNLFQWFSASQMKANPDKCHFITSENKELVINVKYNITNSMNYKAMYTA